MKAKTTEAKIRFAEVMVIRCIGLAKRCTRPARIEHHLNNAIKYKEDVKRLKGRK